MTCLPYPYPKDNWTLSCQESGACSHRESQEMVMPAHPLTPKAPTFLGDLPGGWPPQNCPQHRENEGSTRHCVLITPGHLESWLLFGDSSFCNLTFTAR